MIFSVIRQFHPVIHAITNPVTMTDVVNAILASGAAAICADNEKEAAEITGLCQGLLLNTGMPKDEKLQAMILAGREANRRGIPVVLDPVGAGSSSYRRDFIRTLLGEIHFACIRCNMSEAAALSGITFASHGVEDAGITLPPAQLQQLAAAHDTILAVTGETDYTVSSDTILESRTGTPLLKRITGAGCMLSGLTAAALAAQAQAVRSPSDSVPAAFLSPVQAVHQLLRDYGTCAEQAAEVLRQSERGGIASFRVQLIDAISLGAGL